MMARSLAIALLVLLGGCTANPQGSCIGINSLFIKCRE